MSEGTEKGQHREDLGDVHNILDLGSVEQGREGGRGFYPEDNGEPWRHFKKESGVVTWTDFFKIKKYWGDIG